MLVDSSDDERAYTRRYTEDGINVLALDRHGRGLHRARPERRFPVTSRFFQPVQPERSWLSTLMFLALVGLAIALAIRS